MGGVQKSGADSHPLKRGRAGYNTPFERRLQVRECTALTRPKYLCPLAWDKRTMSMST